MAGSYILITGSFTCVPQFPFASEEVVYYNIKLFDFDAISSAYGLKIQIPSRSSYRTPPTECSTPGCVLPSGQCPFLQP